MQAHDDVVGRRLGARPAELHVLSDCEAEGAVERSLEGGDVYLSVALSGVSVTDFEERSFHVHGNVEGGARDQFLVVEIAGVNPRRRTVDAPIREGRRDAHAPKERPQWD